MIFVLLTLVHNFFNSIFKFDQLNLKKKSKILIKILQIFHLINLKIFRLSLHTEKNSNV